MLGDMFERNTKDIKSNKKYIFNHLIGRSYYCPVTVDPQGIAIYPAAETGGGDEEVSNLGRAQAVTQRAMTRHAQHQFGTAGDKIRNTDIDDYRRYFSLCFGHS